MRRTWNRISTTIQSYSHRRHFGVLPFFYYYIFNNLFVYFCKSWYFLKALKEHEKISSALKCIFIWCCLLRKLYEVQLMQAINRILLCLIVEKAKRKPELGRYFEEWSRYFVSLRTEILKWNWVYIQALPFAPSIAVGTELLGEGRGLAVPGGAEPSHQSGAGSTNQAGQDMLLLGLSSKECYSCKFSQFVHKTTLWVS